MQPNNSKKLAVNQSTQLSQIQKIGTLNEIEFLRQSIGFKKIKEFNLYDDGEAAYVSTLLGVTFTRAANLAGVKSPMDDINKNDISEMMTTVFSGMSIEEVEYAFKMDRYGQLGEKTKHYDLFNADYVSTILNKFKKWASETKFKRNIPISRQLNSPKDLTEEQKSKIVQSGIVKCFNHFKNNGFIEVGYGYVYDFFYELGQLPKHDRFFREKVRRKAVKEMYKSKTIANNITGDVTKVLNRMKKGEEPMRFQCSMIVLRTYFTKLINQNRSIESVLNDINEKQ